MQTALESCAVLKGMWDLFVGLTPELLAAVLAEHLRGHFSGPGREGAVTIVEEADRYRLVFEPCGTGGAMRRRKVAGLTNFRDASAATWQRTNEVPTYCAHCALNEVTSIRRLGYPAWVTEFDPDPEKPCGRTVYKDPALIPERYFTRLGYRKASSPGCSRARVPDRLAAATPADHHPHACSHGIWSLPRSTQIPSTTESRHPCSIERSDGACRRPE
jgi:hypothetical protein